MRQSGVGGRVLALVLNGFSMKNWSWSEFETYALQNLI